jgi:hypothetical protein
VCTLDKQRWQRESCCLNFGATFRLFKAPHGRKALERRCTGKISEPSVRFVWIISLQASRQWTIGWINNRISKPQVGRRTVYREPSVVDAGIVQTTTSSLNQASIQCLRCSKQRIKICGSLGSSWKVWLFDIVQSTNQHCCWVRPRIIVTSCLRIAIDCRRLFRRID